MNVKPGTRALGIAESYRSGANDSQLAGAVVRADRVVDGAGFGRCRVGGLDATEAIVSLFDRLERPDVRYCLLGAIAPAWFNLVDLEVVAEATDRPTIAVTVDASEGLEAGLEDAFDGADLQRRLERYRSLPPRQPIAVGEDTLWMRAVGIEHEAAATVIRAFTPERGPPEPIRVASVLARAADRDGSAVG